MKEVKKIAEKLKKIGKKCYIVWGWCREYHLGGTYSWDIDLATDALPSEMETVLKVIKEVGKKYGTLIVQEGSEVFEITTFRSDIGILDNRKPVEVKFCDDYSIDAMRRDLTCNAIYYDICEERFLDPTWGIEDIKNKNISFVWNAEERIIEDALRILRYVRFAFRYGFTLDAKDTSLIQKNISLLQNISIERIKDEFEKILLLQNTDALKYLQEIWFFEIFLPEVARLQSVPGWPPYHLEWDVFLHTMMTLDELYKMTKNGISLPDENGNMMNKIFFQSEIILYSWALLLHDIAKYDTFSQDENGNVHYYDHESLWLEWVRKIAKRWSFQNILLKKVLYLVENHLRIFKIFQMKTLKVRSFMIHPYFRDMIVVGIADNLGRIPAKVEMWEKLIHFYAEFLKEYSQMEFYNGREIIAQYPNLQGAEIKKMLQLKNDEILGGKKKKQRL